MYTQASLFDAIAQVIPETTSAATHADAMEGNVSENLNEGQHELAKEQEKVTFDSNPGGSSIEGQANIEQHESEEAQNSISNSIQHDHESANTTPAEAHGMPSFDEIPDMEEAGAEHSTVLPLSPPALIPQIQQLSAIIHLGHKYFFKNPSLHYQLTCQLFLELTDMLDHIDDVV